jgi:GTPase SAR1 family protein
MEKSKTQGGTDTGSSKLKYDYLVKVKMVGDSNAGKSSIVIRFCEDSFTDNTMPTIGK